MIVSLTCGVITCQILNYEDLFHPFNLVNSVYFFQNCVGVPSKFSIMFDEARSSDTGFVLKIIQ